MTWENQDSPTGDSEFLYNTVCSHFNMLANFRLIKIITLYSDAQRKVLHKTVCRQIHRQLTRTTSKNCLSAWANSEHLDQIVLARNPSANYILHGIKIVQANSKVPSRCSNEHAGLCHRSCIWINSEKNTFFKSKGHKDRKLGFLDFERKNPLEARNTNKRKLQAQIFLSQFL